MHFLPAEEQRLIIPFALLPYALLLYRQDIQTIEKSKMKVKEPYLKLIRQAIKVCEQEWNDAKKRLKSKGVHVYKEQRTESGVVIYYTFKGYHHHSQFKWDYVKSYLIQFMDESLWKGISMQQRDFSYSCRNV